MNRGSKLRDRIRDATNEAILDAAETVFAEDGVHAAKVDSIAARAGVSVGTLYNHIGDRDAIFTALMVARKGELLDRLDDLLEEIESRPFTEQLSAFVALLFKHFEDHARFMHIVMQGEVRYDRSTHMRETMCAMYERVDVLLKRGVEQRAILPNLMELHASFLMGAVRSAFMRDQIYGRPPQPLMPLLPDFVRTFLHGAAGNVHV